MERGEIEEAAEVDLGISPLTLLATSRLDETEPEPEPEPEQEREMADVPSIFLSHTGEQKDFTRCLYQELLNVGHRPFFDQDADALPKGSHFPARIVDACRRCKMGIVVLSHKYLESLWPMLELEQLTFHNPSVLLYPLFYGLQPADLSSQDNLQRWQSKWDSRASSWPITVLQASSHHIEMSSWPGAVRRLRYQTGEVRLPNMEEYDYIQNIVSNICRALPPPQRYRLGDQFKGMRHMQQDINVLFQQQELKSNGLTALGVYGVGGSGKSTLCKNMASFYNSDFPGRSCWLEFSSDRENHEKQLLEAIKNVLPNFAGGDRGRLDGISSIAEAMTHLAEGLKRHRVFLAMDNLWYWDLENARQIVEMEYMSGSRVMVTSRSKQVLRRLSLETVHVPSITEDEAVEALCFYSHACSFPHENASPEDLRSLVQSCYYEGHCHPLLLKAVGDKLKQVGGQLNDSEDWRNFISHLQACRGGDYDQVEDTILEVLETSFLAMPTNLQSIFIDLVTCPPPEYGPALLHSDFWKRFGGEQEKCYGGEWEWLSMLHHGYTPKAMRYQFIQLEYHGLLEITTDDTFQDAGCQIYWVCKYGQQVSYRIHDLHKRVARKHLSTDAACNFFFQGCLSQIKQTDVKYAVGTGWPFGTTTGILSMFRCMRSLVDYFSKLEILVVSEGHGVKWLSVQGMGLLRFLSLKHCKDLQEIKGWEGAPNLISVRLSVCSSLRKVGNIGCLQKLQELVLCSGLYRRLQIPDLTALSELKALSLSVPISINSFSKPPKLQVLDRLRLVDPRALCAALTALQKLDLHGCRHLKKFPDVNLTNLVRLNLRYCECLESIEGSVWALTSLEELALRGCKKLQRIPSLENLGRLKAFEAVKCSSLMELQFGVSALTSLQICNLEGCTSLKRQPDLTNISRVKMEELLGVQLQIFPYSSAAREPLMSAFVNLQKLGLHGSTFCDIVSLDVSGLVSLQDLSLADFSSLRTINVTGLRALRRLHLKECFSLEELGGDCTLAELDDFYIEGGSPTLHHLPVR